MEQKPTYSIAITTFVHRLDKYYKPLMNAISRMRPDIQKVVFVNGQHKKPFDQEYRKEIMRFSSLCPQTYLIMSPIVRGCSHMWNMCANSTDSDYVLVLNDDVMVLDGFFDEYEKVLAELRDTKEQTFRINNTFSHFSLYKKDLFGVGYFDERLIGFGEEDGDWIWRWELLNKTPIKSMMTNKIVNCGDVSETNGENTKKRKGKYSAFNHDWIFTHKYNDKAASLDPQKPYAVGMYGRPIQMFDGAFTPDYYPAEKWYRENIDNL